jgi:hypothetical protein
MALEHKNPLSHNFKELQVHARRRLMLPLPICPLTIFLCYGSYDTAAPPRLFGLLRPGRFFAFAV